MEIKKLKIEESKLSAKEQKTVELLKKNGIVLNKYEATPYEYPISNGGVHEQEVDIQKKKNPFEARIEEKINLLQKNGKISKMTKRRTRDITGETLNNMYRHRIDKDDRFKKIQESAQFKIEGNHFVIVTKNPVTQETKIYIEEALKSTKDVSEEIDTLVDMNTKKIMDSINGNAHAFEDTDIKNKVLKTIGITDPTDNTHRAVQRMKLADELDVSEKVEALLKKAIKTSTLRAFETAGLVYKDFGKNGGAGLGFIRMTNKGALPPHAEFTPIANNDGYYQMELSIRIPMENNI